MTVRTAVVLAAGEGTRLRPLTRNRPKPMLPAADRPILEHVVDVLAAAGIEHVVVVVGYKRDRVQDHFGPTYQGTALSYVVQDKQLGSGHALLQAREAVDGPLLVVNGDRIIDEESVRDVIDAYESDGTAPSMAVFERPDVQRYGAVAVRDGAIEEIVEKPDSGEFGLINGGIYAFPESIFDEIEATPRRDGELALTDTIDRLVEREQVRAVVSDGLWVDATYPWDLLAVASEVLARGRVEAPQRTDGVWVADSARVHESAVLQPPVVVGADAQIGPGAVVGPETALGPNVTVGATASVQRSVLDADARVDAGATMADAILGQDVSLGAGSVIPGGEGDVQVGTHVHEDQRLGAVLADRVRARGAVSIAPGTLVGPSATLATGTHVDSNVEEGADVRR